MDTSKNIVLKENYAFFVGDANGNITGNEHGLYAYDTRFLSLYSWNLNSSFQTILAHSSRPDKSSFHYSAIEGPSQVTGVHRKLSLSETKLSDTMVIENTSNHTISGTLQLSVNVDFIDLFEARGFSSLSRTIPSPIVKEHTLVFSYEMQKQNGKLSCTLTASEQFDFSEGILTFPYSIVPGASKTIEVTVSLDHPDHQQSSQETYTQWRRHFPKELYCGEETADKVILKRAIDDLRGLALHTPEGSFPAAGIPWFVAAFGRDSIITSYMMLPWQTETAHGVIKFLGRYQGKTSKSYKSEEPGKILHELRHGELTKIEKTPHNPYYGTIDATPLYIMLIDRLVSSTGNFELINEYRRFWEPALSWIHLYGDADNDGFVEYIGAERGKGLIVQSWKDSEDSMSHEDGSLATGSIVPVEVQGYVYAAYCAGTKFYEYLGEQDKVIEYRSRAEDLKEKFHAQFWLEDLNTYAMALDHNKKPLRVKNSNAGHLLWSGIVPEKTAGKLVQTLFSEELWSGWGVRTLGTKEVRYNPVSYHNGSVWPHDTAIIAFGLQKYGFREEAKMIKRSLYDLAFSQHDFRLPELIAGYKRGNNPPVPYPVACRPQAWDAAALIMLYSLE